ncbi:MAG: hypothetical protein V4541_09060 [Bacteroidota bacterium]
MKRVFFAALFAVVAIGGAFATSSNKALDPYYDSNGNAVDCIGIITSCESLTLYSVQNPAEQNEDNQIKPEDLEDTFHN